jgi:hypothetical protein
MRNPGNVAAPHRPARVGRLVAAALLTGVLAACGSSAPVAAGPTSPPPVSGSPAPAPARTPQGGPATAHVTAAPTTAKPLPSPGNPHGGATVPADGRPVDTSHPDRVVGTGTPASCTSAAVVKAVAAGGIVTFDCGPAPVTITMAATAKVVNTRSRVVLDGGGKVTLSGGGKRRILYMDTCDKAQTWTTSHCQDQETPVLVVQNLTFAEGDSTGQLEEGGGGGAILDRGGRLRVVNSRFVGNRCDPTGPDLGGAAIRALSQSHNLPVYVVGSTFTGGVCSNGGGLSSIGVSWTVLNCVFTGNQAIGRGANPASAGAPGGGSGGAIYTDGNTYTVTISGTTITGNHAKEGGGAVFYVSNDRTGTMSVTDSTLTRNPSDGFHNYPGTIFFLGARPPSFIRSTVK